ncbi:MAG: hypothetical protein M0Z66_10250 [Thermaerobacter sp.]|nr:hypothetical protein [Thermaerobacter sp.]
MKRNKQRLGLRALRYAAVAFVVALLVTWPTQTATIGWPVLSAFPILLLIILLGVAFDIVGVAATRAHETPFHARSATRRPGARKALRLVREADRVATVCSDMVGDIAGTLSGALTASLAVRIAPVNLRAAAAIVSIALVSALTIGLKSAAKGLAIRQADTVVWLVGRLLEAVERVLPLHILEAPRKRRRGGL